MGIKAENTPAVKESLKRLEDELSVAGYSPKTKEMYLIYVEEMLLYLNMPPASISRENVISFMAHKKEEGLKGTTMALVFASLKFFFHTHLKHKIMEDIKRPKKAKKLPVVMTKEEVRRILKAAPTTRDRLILQFLYSSGLRVSEIVNMERNSLELTERTAVVRGGKGNKDRLIILAETWCDNMKKYFNEMPNKSDYVFSGENGSKLSVDTIQRIVRVSRKKAGIQKNVTPHSFRHSFATHLLEEGESIRKIQELLGHADLSTTQIYTKVSAEELKKVKSPLDLL